MRTFFDGVFIDREKLKEAGINYPIKLEYYKILDTENSQVKYGIEIIKTEYLDENVKIETKEIKNIINNSSEQERILMLLKNNEVTPIGVEDVLQDLLS